MGLACDCDGDYDWYYQMDEDYSINKRKKICYDCETIIPKGSYFLPGYTYEMNEDGNEINCKNFYFCEKCADIYFNLSDLNYCISLGEKGNKTMQECLHEYHELVEMKKDE